MVIAEILKKFKSHYKIFITYILICLFTYSFKVWEILLIKIWHMVAEVAMYSNEIQYIISDRACLINIFFLILLSKQLFIILEQCTILKNI